jgi:hypothetical protein
MSAFMPTQLKDPYPSTLSEAMMKTTIEKGRGRLPSDDFFTDVSTAAPSPEASPIFGPERQTPLCGPGQLLLDELDALELPEAESSSCEEFYDEDEAEFQMTGFDEEKEDCSTVPEAPSHQSYTDDESSDDDEDVEGDILALLHELRELRSESRQELQMPESRLQKIPYPQLDSGFLPPELMLTKSWLIHAGHAETGQWAYAMAPRPTGMDTEPLNICLGPCGATLEVACGWSEECWADAEQKRASKAKEVFRRRRGRSRSPEMLMLEELQASGARGRSR